MRVILAKAGCPTRAIELYWNEKQTYWTFHCSFVDGIIYFELLHFLKLNMKNGMPVKWQSLRISKYGLILIFFALIACGKDEAIPEMEEEDTPPEEPVTSSSAPGIGEARDISSLDLVAEMGVGWNLGNWFDVTDRNKTLWGNPTPSKAMIDLVKAMGFTTLRIPVTWGTHQDANAPYEIETSYLDQVQSVVDYGFANQMHVILNVHHDDDWVRPIAAEAEEAKARLSSLWTQVANHFIDYNDSLIFETLNEPRLKGIPEEWSGGTEEGRGYINEFHLAAVNAIRATGGNNELRHIMLPTWAASTVPAAMESLEIPTDDPKIIISLHSYFPWPFAGEASIPWGTEQDRSALESELDKIRNKWIVNERRPVVLGEWGSVEENPLETRIDYARFYASEAKERGLLTIVWDDGGRFRMLNRHGLSWDYESLAATIVAASRD
jgi:endoglucanase